MCTFGQIVATLDCLVRSSYPQLHGIVTVIQILQGGFRDCALIMADIPIDRFALSRTLVRGNLAPVITKDQEKVESVAHRSL